VFFSFVRFGMDHPRAQLIANIAERGLYAAATAGAGYLAHQTTGPLGGFTKRMKMESNDNAQDGFMCNALGVGCSDRSTSANGGSSGAAGASATPGSIIQNAIGPATAPPMYRKFRMTGTILLQDGSKANTWSNIPWEFPRFWLRNRELWQAAQNYQYFRTKQVKISFKNPHQQYNTISGTQTISGFDHSAKLFIYEDVGQHMGTPLFVGMSSTNYVTLCKSWQTGGFNGGTNAAFFWPYTADMTAGNINTYTAEQHLTDGGPNVEQISTNVGSVATRSYSPTNDEWRSTCELNMEITATTYANQWNDSGTDAPSTFTIADNSVICPFRADNASCRLIHNGLSLFSTRYLQTYDCTAAKYYTKLPTTSATFPGDTYKYEKVNTRYDKDTATTASFLMFTPEVIERHPQPQLWLNFQNLLAADFASPQQQGFQIQFEYEWTVEFSGRYVGFRGNDVSNAMTMTTATMKMNNFYEGHNVLAPTRYYAMPFYSCAYNLAGDGNNDNPVTTQKNAINLLNWRYVLKDDA
jgi:hypothetical protein